MDFLFACLDIFDVIRAKKSATWRLCGHGPLLKIGLFGNFGKREFKGSGKMWGEVEESFAYEDFIHFAVGCSL